jgi:hypothetical protein
LDTGALIALERRRAQIWKVLRLARLAGECVADVVGATTIDAIVMASAAQRGDAVYTTDVSDLDRLRAFFPGVRVFGV